MLFKAQDIVHTTTELKTSGNGAVIPAFSHGIVSECHANEMEIDWYVPSAEAGVLTMERKQVKHTSGSDVQEGHLFNERFVLVKIYNSPELSEVKSVEKIFSHSAFQYFKENGEIKHQHVYAVKCDNKTSTLQLFEEENRLHKEKYHVLSALALQDEEPMAYFLDGLNIKTMIKCMSIVTDDLAGEPKIAYSMVTETELSGSGEVIKVKRSNDDVYTGKSSLNCADIDLEKFPYVESFMENEDEDSPEVEDNFISDYMIPESDSDETQETTPKSVAEIAREALEEELFTLSARPDLEEGEVISPSPQSVPHFIDLWNKTNGDLAK